MVGFQIKKVIIENLQVLLFSVSKLTRLIDGLSCEVISSPKYACKTKNDNLIAMKKDL